MKFPDFMGAFGSKIDSNKDGVLQLAEHQGEDSDGQLDLEELPALVDTLTSWQNINE